MSKTNVITARLSDETTESLDALAGHLKRSRAWVIQQAVEHYVARESQFLEFIQTGIDSADRGELISQEEMEAWFAERKANRSSRIAAFYAEAASDYADRVGDAAIMAGRFLAEYPFVGPPVDKVNARKWRVASTSFLLIYRPVGHGVQILRVHHMHEDWRSAKP
jgi:toxin ParE1/3/4